MKGITFALVGLFSWLCISSVAAALPLTARVGISGVLDARTSTVSVSAIPTVCDAGTSSESCPATNFADLAAIADFHTSVEIVDSVGAAHTVSLFFFKTSDRRWLLRAYALSEDVDPVVAIEGAPRRIGGKFLTFKRNALRLKRSALTGFNIRAAWNNGAPRTVVKASFLFWQQAAPSQILATTVL